jgi:hypothetical protein
LLEDCPVRFHWCSSVILRDHLGISWMYLYRASAVANYSDQQLHSLRLQSNQFNDQSRSFLEFSCIHHTSSCRSTDS